MNIVFLMDPLDTVIPEKDTSLLLMVGAHNRGHRVFYLPKGGISFFHNEFSFKVNEVVPRLGVKNPFMVKKQCRLSQDKIDAIIIRTDPPFDEDYLAHTLLLERLPKRIAIWNTPSAIRSVNEKIWATQFHSIIPKTMISREKDDYNQFLNHQKRYM